MTGRRDGRRIIYCPACRVDLAFVRREMVVLRRLITTDNVHRTERVDDGVRITCRCGCVSTIRWATFQW